VTVGPQLAALTQGDSIQMLILVDSAGTTVPGVPVSLLNLDPALIRLGGNLWVVARTGTPGGSAAVVVQIPGHEDTLRVTVFPPSSPPPPAPLVFAGDSTDGVVLNSGVSAAGASVRDIQASWRP
jgi:hypothetical protein